MTSKLLLIVPIYNNKKEREVLQASEAQILQNAEQPKSKGPKQKVSTH